MMTTSKQRLLAGMVGFAVFAAVSLVNPGDAEAVYCEQDCDACGTHEFISGYDENGEPIWDYYCYSCETDACTEPPPPPPPPPVKKILYFHGTHKNIWTQYGAFIPHDSTWSDHAFWYDGNARLGNSGIRSLLRTNLINLCSAAYNGPEVKCVLIGFSAGMLRILMAVKDAQNMGHNLRIVWVGAYGSVAGGTELATKCTQGWEQAFCIAAGMHTSIDGDMTVNHTRNSMAAYQNILPPTYHVAGNQNICNYGICGNSYMPGGYGDGAVPHHSSGGYAQAGARSHLCLAYAKYTNRLVETCSPYAVNHYGVLSEAIPLGANRIAGTY